MISHLDHFVLTTRNVARCVHFYTKVLNMQLVRFGGDPERIAFKYGQQKINVHEYGHEFEPKAANPTPGALDLCFVTDKTVPEVMERLREHGVVIEEGPVPRTGARFPLTSVYCRDPDGNLIEISEERRTPDK